MKKLLFVSALVGSVVAAEAVVQAGDGDPFDPRSGHVLTMAVYGDAPYGTTPTDTSQTLATPAFIDSINADAKVDLVVHVGDIHSGKQFCTEEYDRTVFDLWTRAAPPSITPTAIRWPTWTWSARCSSRFPG
jgi:hypothetical protein